MKKGEYYYFILAGYPIKDLDHPECELHVIDWPGGRNFNVELVLLNWTGGAGIGPEVYFAHVRGLAANDYNSRNFHGSKLVIKGILDDGRKISDPREITEVKFTKPGR